MSCKEYITQEDIERIFQNFLKDPIDILYQKYGEPFNNLDDIDAVLNLLQDTYGFGLPEYRDRIRSLNKKKKRKLAALAQAKKNELNALFGSIDLSRANLAIALAGFVAALSIEIEQLSELQIIGTVRNIVNNLETLVKTLKGIDVAQMATSVGSVLSASTADPGSPTIMGAAVANAQHALSGVLSESNNLTKSISGTIDSIMSIAETTTGIMAALKAISLIMKELQGMISTVVQFVQNVLASVEQAVASIAMGVLQLTDMFINKIATEVGKYLNMLKISSNPISEDFTPIEQLRSQTQF